MLRMKITYEGGMVVSFNCLGYEFMNDSEYLYVYTNGLEIRHSMNGIEKIETNFNVVYEKGGLIL